MNLLGIDIGTTGCKVALFSPQGDMLGAAYREYAAQAPKEGWAELDSEAIWNHVQDTIRSVMQAVPAAPVKALAISSLGEACVPVSAERQILGPAILNFDHRGLEFLDVIQQKVPAIDLFSVNGNTPGNNYSLTKLMWIKAHQPELYTKTYKFLYMGAFIAFMLGADPVVDYSLANRSLLFDLQKADWSESLADAFGLDIDKLPKTAPAGRIIGKLSTRMAASLGLPQDVLIVNGAHDQCANAVGCGVIDAGSAVFGMGTYHCITPVFASRPQPQVMVPRGLNIEQHDVPDRYVSFIYNQGGSIVKWFRDTFAREDYRQAEFGKRSIYDELFAEIPEKPGKVIVLPYFSTTGTSSFLANSYGLVSGLQLETTRGEILKGIIEGSAFYLKEIIESLPATGIQIDRYYAAGGGSKSDRWVQTCTDIFGRIFYRPAVTEAGALGAAIIAGVGSGTFISFTQGTQAMIKAGKTFLPDASRHEYYLERFQRYLHLRSAVTDYLQDRPFNP